MSDGPAAAVPFVAPGMDAALGELRALLGDRLSTSAAVRRHHGEDATHHIAAPPDAVAFATSTEDVQAIVRCCAHHRVPVIPFGTGTSLEGHISAPFGGVCIDLSRMDEVLAVSAEDLDCRVQAGVTRKQLNDYLRSEGLFFPVDPGADASLGGMAATGASGTNAVRYRTMRENVLGLTVVLADGRVIRTGTRARKSSAGYDLTRLFVGSEGTLGVITEVQLRLQGFPEAIAAAVCSFGTLRGAVDTTILTLQMGIPVARIELLDELQIEAVNRHSRLDYPALPTLFFEFHGSASSVEEQAKTVGELAADNGGSGFRWAARPEDRTRLWEARHEAFWAAKELRPGCMAITTDVCVPISRLADCVLETRADIDAQGFTAPIVGHVGDGNFHVILLVDPGAPEEVARAEAFNRRLIERALGMGGTCTGEHGVGAGKIGFLELEAGDAIGPMQAIKRALDPLGLMNPGKILRDSAPSGVRQPTAAATANPA
jgi:D-lactate dehydrogenase (cytochrome)